MEITKNMIMNARTYLPLEEKEAFAAKNAARCFDRLQISAGNDAMPPMYMENAAIRLRYLMYAMAHLYLGASVETDTQDGGAESELMTVAEYDKWAGSHVFMQMERLKKEADIRNKVFDLLSDYFQLEKMFDRQIRGLLDVQNDAVVRQSMMMKADAAELPKLIEALNALRETGKGE